VTNKTYTNLLFDWDGCIAKTLQIHMAAYKQTFAEYDLYPSQEDIAHKVFGDWEGSLNVGLDRADLDAFVNTYLERVDAQFSDAPLYPNAFEVVEHFSATDKKLAVVTSSTIKHVGPALEKTKLKDFFDVVLAAEDVQQHKPAAEIVEKVLALTGGIKAEAIIIGDSKSDLGAAQNAGIDSVLFFPEDHKLFYDKDKLIKEYQPTFVIEDHEELRGIL
jgi:pyrophosphatase PpaX